MINKQDEKRRTALHIAAEKIRMKTKEQKSLLSVLLEKQGINHKLHDNRGRTALDVFLENADHDLDCNFWESVCKTIRYPLEIVREKELQLTESKDGELRTRIHNHVFNPEVLSNRNINY